MENSVVEEIKVKFSSMKTRADVAALLGITDRSLRYFLFKIRPENMYHTFEIPKKNGSYRKISAPDKKLKNIQRKLAFALVHIYIPKTCAYGFINNKSFVDNAKRHTKRTLVFNIDLKDFFEQIHFGRVRGMLMKAPYSIGEEAATTIAQIACFNSSLPQGSPLSPILTNMICAPLDNKLMHLAKKTDCTYTRYADDITFSTHKKKFDELLVYSENNTLHVGYELLKILKQNTFAVNPEKTELRSQYDRQEVTGLTVNAFPNPRRSYIKTLRAILHHCEKSGIYHAAQEYVAKGYCRNKGIIDIIDDLEKEETVKLWFRKVLIGKIVFIRQVKGLDSLTYLSFAQKLNTVFNEAILDTSALSILDDIIAQNTYILECDQENDCTQGSGFYLKDIGLFTSYHVTKNNGCYKVFTHIKYPNDALGEVKKAKNELSSDEKIDYALYEASFGNSNTRFLQIGESRMLKTGDQVILVGYPNHQTGNTPYIQTCSITSSKFFHNAPFYTVSGRIVHGASGGIVLNESYEVIGIIKGGIATLAEDDDNENQGFVPIHLVMEHLEAQNIPTI